MQPELLDETYCHWQCIDGGGSELQTMMTQKQLFNSIHRPCRLESVIFSTHNILIQFYNISDGKLAISNVLRYFEWQNHVLSPMKKNVFEGFLRNILHLY